MHLLIVEDQVSMVLTYRMVLGGSLHRIEVARNSTEAVEMLKRNRFDVVITDWMMPGDDGVRLTQWIHANLRPSPPVVMVTSLDHPGAAQKAIDAGADEYLPKPIVPAQLLSVLERFSAGNKRYLDASTFKGVGTPSTKIQNLNVIALAAGSGSLPVLQRVLGGIGTPSNAVLLVVMHGPSWSIEALLSRLSSVTKLPASIAKDGERIENGRIFFAPGDRNMEIDQDGETIRILASEPENFVRPSADPLMRSAARTFGSRTVGLILGGIGSDGAIGAGFIHTAGGKVIVLDPSEATVPQMCERVMEIGMADYVLKSDAMIGMIRGM